MSQLLNYISGSIQVQCKQTEGFPAIPVCVLVYHGQSEWRDEPLRKIFGKVPENLRKYTPDFEYIKVDFTTFTDSEIKRLFLSLELSRGSGCYARHF